MIEGFITRRTAAISYELLGKKTKMQGRSRTRSGLGRRPSLGEILSHNGRPLQWLL